MKFCAVVPEICHGQVHGPRKERRIIIIIIIRNGAKTISPLALNTGTPNPNGRYLVSLFMIFYVN
jgi:hypothetical protein